MKMNHSKIPSLCNSKFDPLSIEITRITENEINVGSTQTQDFDQYLFFKSSEMMINIHCSTPIISKMINFDHIWQLLCDDADYDINTALYGGTRNSEASLIPKVISNIRNYTSVGKVADHPGHLPNLNMVHNANDGNGNNNDDVANQMMAAAMYGNIGGYNNANGGASSSGGGGGGGSSGGGGGGGGGNDELLTICCFSMQGQLIATLATQIAANHYESWERFGAAVSKVWQNEHGTIVEERHPALCWPGCQTLFGRWDGGNLINLNWTHHEWQTVRAHIHWLGVKDTSLIQFARSLRGMGQAQQAAAYNVNGLRIYMHNELVLPIDFIDTNIIPNNYNSWNRFGGAIFTVWLRRHTGGLPIPESLEREVLPSNCWPGSVVSFGRIVPGHYTDIRWPQNLWHTVRTQINCVVTYALQQ